MQVASACLRGSDTAFALDSVPSVLAGKHQLWVAAAAHLLAEGWEQGLCCLLEGCSTDTARLVGSLSVRVQGEV